MPLEDFCYHTFLHWVEEVAHCAVCQKEFDYDYDPSFIGVFPRDTLEKKSYIVVNSTSIAGRTPIYEIR